MHLDVRGPPVGPSSPVTVHLISRLEERRRRRRAHWTAAPTGSSFGTRRSASLFTMSDKAQAVLPERLPSRKNWTQTPYRIPIWAEVITDRLPGRLLDRARAHFNMKRRLLQPFGRASFASSARDGRRRAGPCQPSRVRSSEVDLSGPLFAIPQRRARLKPIGLRRFRAGVDDAQRAPAAPTRAFRAVPTEKSSSLGDRSDKGGAGVLSGQGCGHRPHAVVVRGVSGLLGVVGVEAENVIGDPLRFGRRVENLPAVLLKHANP